ncbi:MAG: RNA methyltransferase [Proteobacteria bacterium]|nr:RNA methyltransferase [Pseudomonadota bacterium]
MAGTNSSLAKAKNTPLAPVIILVGPQFGENIGMCARAMLNCAVTELRIVNPRDGWPNPAAVASASGATDVLDRAKIYTTTKDAVADLEFVLATTARTRDLVKKIYSTDAATKEISHRNATGKQKCGILFGPERSGLENDDVVLANAILNIPLNPGFSSLNLAQAVLLVCFSWLSEQNPFRPEGITVDPVETSPATKEEIELLLAHIEDELVKGDFFRSPAQKPTILRNIRNFFFRAAPTQQDVRTLRGIVSCLTGKRSWK